MTEEELTIATRAQSILVKNHALTLASTGGTYSPWLLGVYFASDDLKIYTFVEASGKSMRNLIANPHVAFMVSENDAQKDFLQGTATAVLLPATEATAVRARLVAKMPWYETYTPVVPVRIDAHELFVSSFASGWFPAKRLNLR